jgi:hypothetical protein
MSESRDDKHDVVHPRPSALRRFEAMIDRSDAVNLARDLLDNDASPNGVTAIGIRRLASAVLRMDAELVRLYALQPEAGTIDGLKLALQYIAAQHLVWDKTELNAWHLLSRLESGIQALIDHRSNAAVDQDKERT